MTADQTVWRLRGPRRAVVMEVVAPTGEIFCLFCDVTDLKHRDDARCRSAFSKQLTQDFLTLCDTIEGLLANVTGATQSANQAVARLRAVVKQRNLTPRAVGLSQYLARAVQRIRRRLPAGIGLEAVIDAGLWPVEIDSDGLARALAELTANAIEAMPKSGRIIMEAINVRLTPDSKLVMSGLASGDYVRLSVQDTGQGMPQEWVDRAVLPFKSRKEKSIHLGLGLTIVHAFAIESGGWLDVDGGAGSGASIHLYLPKAARADATERPGANAGCKPSEVDARPPKKRIRRASRSPSISIDSNHKS